MINYYKELELDTYATIDGLEEEIKALQKKWIRRQTSANQERRHEAENKIQLIAEAKEILLDPAAKDTYDEKLLDLEEKMSQQDQQPSPTAGGYYHISDEEFNQLVDRFWDYADAKDFSSALAQSQHLTTVATNKFMSWYLHGYSNRLFGNLELSIGYFNKAIDMNPSFYRAYEQMGVAYLYLKRTKEAFQTFQKALKLHPKSEIAVRNIGNILLDNGKVDKAIEMYERLGEIRTDDYAQELLAKAYYKKGEQALPHFSNGYFFYEDHKIDTFIHYVTKANELYPKDYYVEEIKSAQKAKKKSYDWSKITLLTIPLFFGSSDFLMLLLFGLIIYFSFRPKWQINQRNNHGIKTTFDKVSGVYTKTVGFAIVAVIGIGLSLIGASFNTRKYT